MPEASPEDILLFIHLRRKVRYTDLHKNFVGRNKIANQTFLNYLKALRLSGKIRKDLDQVEDTIYYYIPVEKEVEIRQMIDNNEFDQAIDAMSEEEAKETLKELMHG